jgi:hypothetical protein
MDGGKAGYDTQTVYRFYMYLAAFFVSWTWRLDNLVVAKGYALRALDILDKNMGEALSESCEEGFWDMGAGGDIGFSALGINSVGREGLTSFPKTITNIY